MFYLPQDFQNTEHLLVFHSVDADGFLKDAAQMGWRVLDPDGTQVFPGSGFEDVLSTGKLSTGRYIAYDTGAGAAWTVPAAATTGIWTIEWEYRVESGDPVKVFSEQFEVVASKSTTTKGFDGSAYRTYIAPCQVRAEGATSTFLNDARLEGLILSAQALTEEMTQNVFRPIRRTIRMNGENLSRMFMGVAIIGVESVQLRSLEPMDTANLVVAFERVDDNHLFRPRPDHRRNPQISFQGDTNIFSGSVFGTVPRFGVGRLNYKITGVFGFLESDGTVPKLIQEAMVRLVIASATLLAEPDMPGSTSAATGPLKKVRAGQHEIEWSSSNSAAMTLQSALARSRIVEEIFGQYRSPQMIAAPAAPVAFGRVQL